jgi:hypothetical protein
MVLVLHTAKCAWHSNVRVTLQASAGSSFALVKRGGSHAQRCCLFSFGSGVTDRHNDQNSCSTRIVSNLHVDPTACPALVPNHAPLPARMVRNHAPLPAHMVRNHALQVVAAEGLPALFIGLAPTLLRNCIWNAAYYGTMHQLDQVRISCTAPHTRLAGTSEGVPQSQHLCNLGSLLLCKTKYMKLIAYMYDSRSRCMCEDAGWSCWSSACRHWSRWTASGLKLGGS